MLALNGQLNASYTGSPKAPEEIAASSKVHKAFEKERKSRQAAKGSKRDRRPFKQLGVQAKQATPGSFEHKLLKAGTSRSHSSLHLKSVHTRY
jgi:hypothetical protein